MTKAETRGLFLLIFIEFCAKVEWHLPAQTYHYNLVDPSSNIHGKSSEELYPTRWNSMITFKTNDDNAGDEE